MKKKGRFITHMRSDGVYGGIETEFKKMTCVYSANPVYILYDGPVKSKEHLKNLVERARQMAIENEPAPPAEVK